MSTPRSLAVLAALGAACLFFVHLQSRPGQRASRPLRPAATSPAAAVTGPARPMPALGRPEAPGPVLTLEPLFDPHRARFTPGEEAALRFRVVDPRSSAPAPALELSFSAQDPAGSSVHLPARFLGGGVYEVLFTPGRAGAYRLALATPSDAALPPFNLDASGPAAPAAPEPAGLEPAPDGPSTAGEEELAPRRVRPGLPPRRR